jgi:hypothetical protein
MRLTAENFLLLVAGQKGHVSAKNQPYFKPKRFAEVIKRMAVAQLVRPMPPGPDGDKRYELTTYGTLGAAFFSMLADCPKELYLGEYTWRLLKE